MNILKNIEILEFLHSLGYEHDDLPKIIERIKLNLRKSKDFPHEIGLLLGYPIKDVKGFIENRGKSFSKSGHWKVYGDCENAEQTFFEYKRCRSCFMELYCQGYNCLEIIEKYNSGRHSDYLLK